MRTSGPANEAHERHLAALKRIGTTAGRREYIDNVSRTEGRFYGKWLADDYAAWWAQQQKKRT